MAISSFLTIDTPRLLSRHTIAAVEDLLRKKKLNRNNTAQGKQNFAELVCTVHALLHSTPQLRNTYGMNHLLKSYNLIVHYIESVFWSDDHRQRLRPK